MSRRHGTHSPPHLCYSDRDSPLSPWLRLPAMILACPGHTGVMRGCKRIQFL